MMRKFRKIFRPVTHKNDSVLASLNGQLSSPDTSPFKQNSAIINNQLLTGRHEDIFLRVSFFIFLLNRDYEPRTNLCVEKNEFLTRFSSFFMTINHLYLFVLRNEMLLTTLAYVPEKLFLQG